MKKMEYLVYTRYVTFIS